MLAAIAFALALAGTSDADAQEDLVAAEAPVAAGAVAPTDTAGAEAPSSPAPVPAAAPPAPRPAVSALESFTRRTQQISTGIAAFKQFTDALRAVQAPDPNAPR